MRNEGVVEAGDDCEQQKPEPFEQEAEVVAGRGENGIDGVAGAVGEIVSLHAMIGFEMSDDGFDGRSPPHLAFDLGRHAAFLARGEDPELVIGGRIVAAISLVGDEALDGVALPSWE